MEANVTRLIWSTIAALGLAWAASARAQELNLDVPAPHEPARISANGSESAKPIPLRRIEPLQPDRRDVLPQPGPTAPRFNPATGRLSPLQSENERPDGPLGAMPNSLPRASREGPAINDGFGLDREPVWTNPAAIPMHENEKPKEAAKPRTRPSHRAGTASSESRNPAGRATGAESTAPPRTGLFNFGARLAARRAASEESASPLARRHRTEPRERNGRQPSAQDGANR